MPRPAAPKEKRKAINGTGTVYSKVRGGKTVYYGQVVIGTKPDGSPLRITSPGFSKEADAHKWKAEQITDHARGTLVAPDRITVAEFLDEWMRTVVADNCKPTTTDTYKGIVDKHLKGTLGNVKLQKLSPRQVQVMYHDLLETGLSRHTVRNVHAVFRDALEHARKQGIILTNPLDSVEKPKLRKVQPPVFTEAHAKQLLDEAKNDRLHALYMIALYLGLRLGELLGLRWQDIDFEAGTLRIEQSFYNIRGKRGFQAPKSETSRRTLPMPLPVAADLRKWHTEQGKERMLVGEAWQYPELVFTTTLGTPINRANLRQRSYYPLLDRAGCPRIKFHALRHTAITAMGASGLPMKVAQELAGHASMSTTANVYGHVWEDRKQAAGKTIGEFWSQPSNQ